MIAAFLLGIFDSLIEFPSQALASRLPVRTSPEAPKPLVLRGGYQPCNPFSDTIRIRKPHSVENGVRRFLKIELLQVASNIGAASLALGNHDSGSLYATMKQSASSPSRWRC